MRNRLAAIKDEVIDHLPDYMDRFQREAEARGVHVYRAADAEAANRYVLELCRARGYYPRRQEQDYGLGGNGA